MKSTFLFRSGSDSSDPSAGYRPGAKEDPLVLAFDDFLNPQDPSIGRGPWLVGGLEQFFFPIGLEESSQLTNIFQRVWNHQPDEAKHFFWALAKVARFRKLAVGQSGKS